jgi:biopolymer transport protein ExbB/TolQ
MTTLALALVLLIALPATEAFWPTTVVGWITVVGFLAGLVSGLWAYAKFLAHLNGLGARVDAVEKEQTAAKERDENLSRAMERMTRAQEQLLEKLGAAEHKSDRCSEDMEQYTREVGSQIHELTKLIQHEGREAGERLKGVETKLDFLMRERERDDRFRRTDQ